MRKPRPPTGRPPGRPAIERNEHTAKQVQSMAGFGLTVIEIGRVIGMSQPTVHKLYMRELETGHIVANAKVAESLFKMATDSKKPVVAAAIFWAKCRMRWREDGDDGGKREAADALSRIADKGTKWDGLLSDGGGGSDDSKP
jgi:hypothetical protein